jgi:SAM-dependent methyltransferase
MFDKDGPTFTELLKQALSSTKGGYDLLASKFDKTPFRTPDEIVEKSVATIGAPVRASLDLCCGTGAGLKALRPLTSERLVGVDFSPGMLEQAKKTLGIESPLSIPTAPQIELVEKDVFDVAYDREFDVVTCFGAFGHILEEAETKFLDIVRKALVPGGRFVFVTGTKPRLYDPRALVARGFNAAMSIRNAFVSPPFIMYYLTFLLPDVERKLRWAGFEVTKHEALFEGPFAKLVVVVAKRPA